MSHDLSDQAEMLYNHQDRMYKILIVAAQIRQLNLPKDKDAKIVLYCRSGGMSRAAAYELAEEGYTNVYDLVGGKNAYDLYKELAE